MYIPASRLRRLHAVTERLTSSLNGREVREFAAEAVLDLMRADYLASYVWDPVEKRFGERVMLNMDPANLAAYERHYQFCDPITPALQRRRRATPVRAVMPQRDLMRTEFFNDFLRRDGLHYGINLYAYHGELNIGDLRIWRRRGRPDFDGEDIALLEMLAPCFANVMRNTRLAGSARAPVENWREKLTPRESEVLGRVLEGLPDKSIARDLGMTFATVRTHLNRVYRKLGVRGRTQLIARALRSCH